MAQENVGGLVDRLKGKAKRAAGAVTGNDALRREGELHEEKADAVERAERLDAEAEQQRAQSDIVAREQELAAAEERLNVEEAADARRARLERERVQAEAAIELFQIGRYRHTPASTLPQGIRKLLDIGICCTAPPSPPSR